MEWGWIWKAIVIIVGGTILLRFAGRKSISQMTLAQTVVMIGIGSLLIQPISNHNIWVTLGAGAVLVLTLVLMEWGQLKSDKVEKWITGQAVMVIDNGQVVERNLRKLRLTVDQLEMRLRLNSVGKITDVQYATLEPNGQLGYVLWEKARPASKKEVEELREEIKELKKLIDKRLPYVRLVTSSERKGWVPNADLLHQPEHPANREPDIFTEVVTKTHKETPPNHLQ